MRTFKYLKLNAFLSITLLAATLITGCGTTTPLPSQSTAASNTAQDNQQTAMVKRVLDGDTIEITLNGKKETVRMILVDTPETVHPDKPKQPFGPEASAFTKELLTGKEVTLERDVTERDRYGRLLFYVYLEGKMVNEMLIEKGLARVAVFPPDVKYVDRFREIQKKAQQAKVGIWSIENYATDKGYNDAAVKPAEQKAPSTPAKTDDAYYAKCADAKAAGKAPLRRGDPGYRSGLDGDGDGIACE